MTNTANLHSVDSTDTRQTPIAGALNLNAYKTTRRALIIVVILQVAVIFALAVPEAFTLTTGKVVTLKTIPVDPYDMFRGDYLNLSYEIAQPTGVGELKTGESIYLTLRKNGYYWQPVSAHLSMPAVHDGEIAIKGKVDSNPFGMFGRSSNGRVKYGIEELYVTEKTGDTLGKSGTLDVDVAVDCFGHAVIKEVRNANKVIYNATSTLLSAHS